MLIEFLYYKKKIPRFYILKINKYIPSSSLEQLIQENTVNTNVVDKVKILFIIFIFYNCHFHGRYFWCDTPLCLYSTNNLGRYTELK